MSRWFRIQLTLDDLIGLFLIVLIGLLWGWIRLVEKTQKKWTAFMRRIGRKPVRVPKQTAQ